MPAACGAPARVCRNGAIAAAPRSMLAPLAHGVAAIGVAAAPIADIMVNAIASAAGLPPIKKLYTHNGPDANASETHSG